MHRIGERDRLRVAVGAAERHLHRRGGRASGAHEDVAQRHALPLRVADQIPAHLIADTLQRLQLLDRRHRPQFTKAEPDRRADQAADVQRPSGDLHHGIKSWRVLADDIELLIDRDLRGKPADAGERTLHRRGGTVHCR